ncbi:MAG: hypothetical protein KKE30_05075 [Gammaproteobacteria bacterium]|nr:hypothetical protein [Gammaproteobacteria bacterium]MBU1554055.1 hypothetical protein [Gammaproteobacteria bacterium]MBU2071669.1 hypothetical protein [Gammaproteobacteria bacterium]MBU2204025.1 hypothetical protein [Gammaproteobacteria bacterium]
MCGYCVERNQLVLHWQYGRFEPQPELGSNASHFISLECPDTRTLYTWQQQGQALEPELVLIRLACDARMKCDATAVPLRKAMLAQISHQHPTTAASVWPWLDNALTHILNYGRLPYTGIDVFPTELLNELEQALAWLTQHIYPVQATDTDDDGEYEQQHEDSLKYSHLLAEQLYQQFQPLLMATLLMQQIQPDHAVIQQIALNHNASFTHFVGLELALRRQAQYHCIQHYGKDWFWQHLHQLELQHIFYLAARCHLDPGEITALQIKLEDEFVGQHYFMPRQDCIDALTMLSLAVEFEFDPDENNVYY